MKRLYTNISALALSILFITFLSGCKKEKTYKYSVGTFPDSVYVLSDINSPYDDYNTDLDYLGTKVIVVFSSNRTTSGGKFDYVTGAIDFTFDKYNGDFDISSEMYTDPYYSALTAAANTPANDFGPYKMLSNQDSHEYMLITTESVNGDLDLQYLKYLPTFGGNIPEFGSLTQVNCLNSLSDDGYISFDSSQKSVFFSSDREGDFNIYTVIKTESTSLSDWFAEAPVAVTKIDSIASDFNDKCPLVSRNILVFTSDRPGGMGGFDLYYSLYVNGKWGSPVNFGPKINSSSNEYRPVIGYHPDFTNDYLIFSSDRPGGKGMYDLYFTGVEIPGDRTTITK